MYRGLIDNMLNTYGSICDIYRRGSSSPVTSRAFITPFHYKTKDFGGIEYGVNGVTQNDTYRYVGSAEPDLSQYPKGSRIVCGERIYRVESAELYFFKGEAIYCRAVLRLFEGGRTND